MQNSNMVMSIFVFYYQKKGIPSENPFLFRKELCVIGKMTGRLNRIVRMYLNAVHVH